MLYPLRQKVPVQVVGLLITLIVFIFAFRCVPERVARPTFHPDGGDFPDSIDVIIYCGTEGATIRYTTDGSDPDGTSTEYTGPINVTSTATMKARGFKGGMSSSTVASATFTIFTPGTIRRVSISTSGEEGNGKSWLPSISADGRYVAFTSEARNLVDGDTNRTIDVFVHDCQTGETTRVSVKSNGEQVGYGGVSPSISGNGRYVAFQSLSRDLVDGDTNGSMDVFMHDRETGQTARVSVSSSGEEGNDISWSPRISADGRYVAFESIASNLVEGDTNEAWDVFRHDRHTGQTTRVSVSSSGEEGNGESKWHDISPYGRWVAFSSEADNLVDGDTNENMDVFVHDCLKGQTIRVSVNSSGEETTGCGAISRLPSISYHGRYVAFESIASDLVEGDINGRWDVFVHDCHENWTAIVSLSSSGDQGNCASSFASISADGCSVAFESCADNLVAGDTNERDDVFLNDCETGETTRVSVSRLQANEGCFRPSISGNGRFVAFQSLADNLVDGDTNENVDIFVYYRGP
jgi:Tol biopolymer transport system component